MKTYLPQSDKQYTQLNRGNVLGSFWSTMGLDLQENPGAIRLSPRLQVLTKTGDANATTLGCAIGFRSLGANYWAIAGSKIYNNVAAGGKANSAFVEDTTTSFSTDYSSDYSDIELFNGRIWATAPTKLRSTGGASWTDRETFAATTVPHILNFFIKFNRLYFAFNGNTVGSINTADASVTSGDYTLTLDSIYQIVCIRSTSTYIYVGTINTLDATGSGVIFQWDGISAQPTNRFFVKGRGCLALTIIDDTPYAMDSNAVLSKFNGSGFQEVGRLPNKGRLTTALNTANDRFIHPNGLSVTKNNTILAWVNNLNADASTVDENFASGLWEFDENKGFMHKKSLTYNPTGTSTITDFGQNRLSRVGAIALATDASSTGIQTAMAGATYFTDATTTTSGIFIENTTDTVQKKGYFASDWIESSEIETTFDRFWAVYRRLLDSTDDIVPKYRLSEVDATSATITWVNTTSFTTTTDVSAYAPTATGFNGTVGGEVEITQGTGSGSTAHILSITGSGTYTVTLDTVITGVTTGTAKARFQKWIKIFPAKLLDQVKSYSQWNIGGTDTRIQLKVCFTFTGAGEFYKSILLGNEDIKALG